MPLLCANLLRSCDCATVDANEHAFAHDNYERFYKNRDGKWCVLREMKSKRRCQC